MDQEPRVLIVDDQPSARESLEALLTGQGYDLAFASNGAEALAAARELEPDVILLDVMMPGMNGFEVCRQLRADPNLAEVPIIMVTALDDRESRLQSIEAGADDFATKPYDRAELRARVRTITRLNRYRRLLMERAKREQAERDILLLKEAERLKDQFVSNVSHELRTPLSTITLLVGNLDSFYDHMDEDKRRKLVRDIRRQTQVLDELIGNILEISRIDGQRISVERQRVDLAQLVREEADKQLPLAQKKLQALQVMGDETLTVMGNESQLRQVIRNLLNNAIKYTPNGGQIRCEGAVYDAPALLQHTQEWPGLADLLAGRWAAWRVIDTGVGIGPQDMPHLFERFYRAQSQGNIPGTGLGLSIAKELVELHHGYIAVASTPGQGSTFAVYLPLWEN
jgi:signal transduction histidine kinase